MSLENNNKEKKSTPVSFSISNEFIFKIFIILALILLTAITIPAVIQFGIVGILEQEFTSTATMQVFTDLVISLSLILVWMWFDSKKSGRKFLPWFLITLVFGVYGPLFYLLFSKKQTI